MSETVQETRQASNVVTSENLSQWMSDKLGLDTKVTDIQPKNEEKVTQEPEKVTQKAESNEDQEAQDAADESKGDPEHKEKVKNSYIKLREQRNAARERIAQLEAELANAKAAKTEEIVQPGRLVKPDPSKFTDAFEYAEALAEYKVNEKLENQQREQAEKAAKEYAEKVSKLWKERVTQTASEIPDYDETLEGASNLTVSDPVRDAIIESEFGPKILYHLAKNPELVSNIAQMTVTGALRAIGRLETKFEKVQATEEKVAEVKETKQVSKAPEPIKPLKGSNAPQLPVDDKGEFTGTIAEYKRLRREGKLR